jgi:hypothetical protein
LYQNNNSPAHWSEIKLNATVGNKENIGVKISLTAGGKTQSRQITSASSLVSRNSTVAHFGLGAETSITNIQVIWTNGDVQNYPNPPVNQILTIDQDQTGPEITFTAPASVAKGTDLVLSMTVQDLRIVSSVTVFAKKITDEAFASVNAAVTTGTNWTATLAQTTHFDAIGTEYYIEAIDNSGNKTRKPTSTDTYKTYLVYSASDAVIPTERLGFGGEVSDWKIFSIPFNLGGGNQISTVFNEVTALQNKIDYRIITYQNETSWSEYPSGLSSIERGVGYFINIKDPLSNISVGDNLTAPANTRTNLFKIDLIAGWNMIGNPYLTQISWPDVAAYNGLTGTAAEVKKYSGSGYSVQSQTLAPYEGAFVFVAGAINDVSVSFAGQTNPGGRRKDSPGLSADINEEAWAVKLNLSQGYSSYRLASVGMAPDASPGFDDYDDITPPRFINYLEVNFSHPEFFAKHFSRDIVPTQSNYIWNFTVDTNTTGEAQLRWDNTLFSTGSKELFLLDIGREKLINMKEVNTFTFNPKESSHFRMYFGEHLAIAPEKVSLGKAYPNPTQSTTAVGFSLPERGGLNQRVTMDILDVTGRPAGTISQGMYGPGYHEVTFPANELKSGFYTYRLTVQNAGGKTTEVNKLIVK